MDRRLRNTGAKRRGAGPRRGRFRNAEVFGAETSAPGDFRNYFLARFAAFFCLGLCLAGFLVCLRAFCDLAMKVDEFRSSGDRT